jgi:arginase
VDDRGDVQGFRWRVDREHPRAMNSEPAVAVAGAVSKSVAQSLEAGAAVLVLGGDCTIEIGTVAGASSSSKRVGLVYIDLDADLNTPETTDDGALDWMGVAHLLGLPGTVSALGSVGSRWPMLSSDEIVLFAVDNITPAEHAVIDTHGIAAIPCVDVSVDPAGTARRVVGDWAQRFERLLVHVDVDVLDYLDLPVAEETRRNRGLRFDQLLMALRVLIAAPNWVALTVCEVNPDHAEGDGSTLETLCDGLADVLSSVDTAATS